ncbi:tetraspanin-18-like isoform 3-T4 [Liasis olivaceus]
MDTVLCMKYLMFFFCLLVFIGALCLIFVAIWVIIDPKRILDISPSYFLTVAACIAILVGLLLSWLCYVGIYATVAEDVKLLRCFSILILVIFIVELLVAILLYFFAEKFQCCGILGPQDFQSAEFFREQQPDDLWPHACCTRAMPPEPDAILDVELCQQNKAGFLNNIGCFSAIGYLFDWYMWTLVGCSLGVLAAEVSRLESICKGSLIFSLGPLYY